MKKLPNFIGREYELKTLIRFLKKQTASLIVIKGRRRIGKSRLVAEFATRNKIKLLSFERIKKCLNLWSTVKKKNSATT